MPRKPPVRYKSPDGLLILDVRGRALFANATARKLLELTGQELRDRRCFELFAGHDVQGNSFCSKSCAVMKMARQREPARHFDLEVATRSGRKRWFSVTTLLELNSTDRTDPSIIHIFRPIQVPPLTDGAARYGRLDAASRLESVSAVMKKFPLSRRQAEILALLTQGLVAKEIGVQLGLSTATVRTHIQHILCKLGVHSKLEAVTLVLRQQRG